MWHFHSGIATYSALGKLMMPAGTTAILPTRGREELLPSFRRTEMEQTAKNNRQNQSTAGEKSSLKNKEQSLIQLSN